MQKRETISDRTFNCELEQRNQKELQIEVTARTVCGTHLCSKHLLQSSAASIHVSYRLLCLFSKHAFFCIQ